MRVRVTIVVGVALAAMAGGAAPGAAKGGPENTESVFVRTTDDGVTIRAYRGSYPADWGVQAPAPCEGPGCPPRECRMKGALVIGFSTDAAVSEGWAELYPRGDEQLRTVMASGFGTMFDAPAAWVAIQTGDRVARVRATFRDGTTDEMRPRTHLAVLASPVHGIEPERLGPTGRVTAFDDDGEIVGRARFGPSETQNSRPAKCAGGLDAEFPPATGPPPADEDAARAAVSAVVTAAYGPPGGDTATTVQDGAALAEVGQIAADRYPQYRDTIAAAIDEVRFIDASHAAVQFGLTTDGQVLIPPGVGRVVLIDGQWLVSRDTFCRILVVGGVYCPEVTDRR